MPEQTPLFSIYDLHRKFGEREVLNIQRLELEENKIYGLLGPNGAGKTTLMRLLSFMDTPSAGTIYFRGTKICPEDASKYRAKVVWVQQFPVLFTGSLLYNIEYPMRLKKEKARVRKEKAMLLLKKVGLEHLAQASAKSLSGGEAQRASIARALAAGAEVIMFDEPTANVDYRSRIEIIELIRSLWQKQKLSLFVTTHDKDLADEICHEQISLFEGKVISQTPTAAGRLSPSGSPFAIPGRLAKDTANNCLSITVGLPLHADNSGKTVMALVRGLAENSESITIRLSLGVNGQSLDILLDSPEDFAAARELQLGSAIKISGL